MAKLQASGTSGIQPLQPDVLILGGGVQGLWLLNDLHRHGYSALLLERRELGGEQTCHSHVYIHQGHLYQEADLAARLKGVTTLWNDWLNTHRIQRGVTPSYFGFQNRADADEKKKLWDDPRLCLPYQDYRQVSLPVALRGGAIQVVLESPETTLNGTSLVRALCRNVKDFISRIEEVSAIRVNTATSKVEEVEVVLPGGQRLTFRPGALVLTAGAGNQALLDLASGGRHPLLAQVGNAQQVRKAHMLAVKGKKDDLAPLTGVFHPFSLFIVSRDLGNEVVWLVSDHRSPPLAFVEDWMEYDGRWWLRQVLAALEQMAPRHFNRPGRLTWGVYAAPKAEGRATGAIPHEERIERFRFANLWAVWPTKLTLAPHVSGEVLTQIRKLLPRPKRWSSLPLVWRKKRQPAAVAPERWEMTPLLAWKEFRRCYNL